MASRSDEELIRDWRQLGTEEEFDLNDVATLNAIMGEREKIVEEMKRRKLYPQEYVDLEEQESGFYPDKEDPQFLQKLLQKQEFAENKQLSVLESIRRGIDPCKGSSGFELSPTQRFIGQFLSPRTPYMSALLFHGVGVGKTCSAITVAENYLEIYPRKQVIILAPRNIQPNFSREIFSETKLTIGEDEEPNTYNGCTGNTYLKLTGTEYSRDKQYIMNRVNHMKARRYQFVGYLAFYNYIKELLDREISQSIKGERRIQEEYKLLNRKFSNRLIVIDEAHNVRDLAEGEEDNQDAPGGKAEMSESQAGKKLTPYLRKLLAATEGTKLLLLTATPMYNNYKEIIPMLNLLLINDKKATVSESDFFDDEGNFLPGGEKAFGTILQGYVSFMRGENPLAFPLRLEPEEIPRVTRWPQQDPLGNPIEDETVLSQIVRLPFVATGHTGQGLADYREIVGRLIVASGLRLGATDGLVQAGNFLFPGLAGSTPLTRIREQGFKGAFVETKEPKQFRLQAGISPAWLHQGNIQEYSPKAARLIERLRTTIGLTFIYSRFVYSGALTIALALEANGYENAMKSGGLLKDPVLAPGGKQCALCPKKQDEHAGSDHSFRQAKYVLLTGRDDLTSNNKGAIELATRPDNKNGEDVKVIIGSQVASEGIDLKFIRELIVFDSWYHLNKLEQVIGRGIRFCSHAALPMDKRNCTVMLLLTAFPETQNQETIDMYQYRIGFEKAGQIGKITRVMKQYAIDCNLNRDAVLITGLDPVTVEDSQGLIRSVPLNDVPFTSVCDWIGNCEYTCGTVVETTADPSVSDISTYDQYAARWRMFQVKERLRRVFSRQPYIHYSDLRPMLADIPSLARAAILNDIVGNRSFRISLNDELGYIIYKNGYYLFQPERLRDTGIPIALRTALFPVKQDSYEEFEAPSRKAVARAVENRAPPPGAGAAAAAASAAPVAPANVEEVVEVRGNVVEFWDSILSLVTMIQDGRLPDARSDKKILPDSIENTLKNRYSANKKSYDKVYNSISMFYRFYKDVQANEDWRMLLARAAVKFLWDELLTTDEQYTVYLAKQGENSELMMRAWSENLVSFDGQTIYRFVNPTLGKIQYKCGGADCSPALAAALEAEDESTDEVRSLRANSNTTGNPYGTLNFKKGIFVFKTNVPVRPSLNPAVREKQERGSECANVANMIPHYNVLEEIGRIAQETLRTNLGFVLSELKDAPAPRGVKNSVRACALTDIALRFFDEIGIYRKRWFYRPLATFYTKHPGILPKKTA